MFKREIDWNSENIQVSTTIPEDLRLYIKENNYRYNELLKMGILAIENNPGLISRISAVEERVEKLEKFTKVNSELIRKHM